MGYGGGGFRGPGGSSSVLFSQGRVLEAEEFATRALNLAEEDQNQAGAGHAHRVLGEINASTGRWQEGLSHLSRSVFLLERSGEHEAGAASHQVLGQVWLDVGQPRRAISEFSIARQEFEQRKDIEGAFRALRGLARCYASINQIATALTYWERALELNLSEALREVAFTEAWNTAQRLRPARRPTWILRASDGD